MLVSSEGAGLFDEQHMAKGKELAAKLLGVLTQNDPRTAMMALMIAYPMTARACGLQVWQTFDALRIFDRGKGTPEERTAKMASSGILVPSR